MPARQVRKNGAKPAAQEVDEQIPELRLIARLLGLALVAGKPMGEQTATLSAAGFPAGEIARMLGTTAASVRQQVYMWRKTKPDQRKSGRNE